MPEHASRFAAALFDQFEDEHPVADWGGDELFTRMPRPRAVDDAPAPRFEPSRVAPAPRAARPSARSRCVDPPEDRRSAPAVEQWSGPRERRRASQTAEAGDARTCRAARPDRRRAGARLVHRWDETGTMIEPEPAGRTTKVITGHPGGAPRPLPTRARRAPAPVAHAGRVDRPAARADRRLGLRARPAADPDRRSRRRTRPPSDAAATRGETRRAAARGALERRPHPSYTYEG